MSLLSGTRWLSVLVAGLVALSPLDGMAARKSEDAPAKRATHTGAKRAAAKKPLSLIHI